jgi:hypothetical protein
MTDTLKRESFDIARRRFEHMTTVFQVVEDAPPYASQWIYAPSDEHDRPIWTAAVRAKADVVLTENLKDGPPPDNHGVRGWGRITYLHPDEFMGLLDKIGHFYETGQQADEETGDPGLSPTVQAFLQQVDTRARTELPPDTAD